MNVQRKINTRNLIILGLFVLLFLFFSPIFFLSFFLNPISYSDRPYSGSGAQGNFDTLDVRRPSFGNYYWYYNPIYEIIKFIFIILLIVLVVVIEVRREKENSDLAVLLTGTGTFFLMMGLVAFLGGLVDLLSDNPNVVYERGYVDRVPIKEYAISWLFISLLLLGIGYLSLEFAEKERIKCNAKRSVKSIVLHAIGTFLLLYGLFLVFGWVSSNQPIGFRVSEIKDVGLLILGVILLISSYFSLKSSKILSADVEITKKTFYTPYMLILIFAVFLSYFHFFFLISTILLEFSYIVYSPDFKTYSLGYNLTLFILFNLITYYVFKRLLTIEKELKLKLWSKLTLYSVSIVVIIFSSLSFIVFLFFNLVKPSQEIISSSLLISLLLIIYSGAIIFVTNKLTNFKHEEEYNPSFESPLSLILYSQVYESPAISIITNKINDVEILKAKLNDLEMKYSQLEERINMLENSMKRKSKK